MLLLLVMSQHDVQAMLRHVHPHHPATRYHPTTDQHHGACDEDDVGLVHGLVARDASQHVDAWRDASVVVVASHDVVVAAVVDVATSVDSSHVVVVPTTDVVASRSHRDRNRDALVPVVVPVVQQPPVHTPRLPHPCHATPVHPAHAQGMPSSHIGTTRPAG